MSAPMRMTSLLVAVTMVACGSHDEESPRATLPSGFSQALDNESHLWDSDDGDQAFIVRATLTLLGRAPHDVREIEAMRRAMRMGVPSGDDPALQVRRREQGIDMLMRQPEFAPRWTEFFLERLRAARDTTAIRTLPLCMGLTSPQTGALADFVRTRPPTEHTIPSSVVDVRAGFTMRDIVASSMLADDLRPVYEAGLFTLLAGADPTQERSGRADLWNRFETTHLGRQLGCVACHNSAFSVTGPVSGWDRHAPLPVRTERDLFHSSNAYGVHPEDLSSDFRIRGVLGIDELSPVGDAPWAMNANCGLFTVPTSSATCSPDPFETPCYGNPPIAPIPWFATTGTTVQPSVFRLHQLLTRGADALAAAPPFDETTATTLDDGEQSFAYVVAANVVNQVWEEVYGSKLTVPHGLPRNAEQRHILHFLVEEFTRGRDGHVWSLRALLRRMLARPDFNRGGHAGATYPLYSVYDPFNAWDPRPLPTSIDPTERCDAASPTWRGCVRDLLNKNTCFGCHAADVGAPARFDEDVTSVEDNVVSRAECEDYVNDGLCNGLTLAHCASMGMVRGSLLAVRVSCDITERIGVPGRPDRYALPRMPPTNTPIDAADRDAIIRWVTTGAREGSVPPLPTPGPTPEQLHNGIGDIVHWRSGREITSTIRAALQWPSGTTFWVDPATSGEYPSRAVAEAAGFFFSETQPGGRGLSFSAMMQWHREHESCTWPGAPDDAITRIVGAASTSMGTIQDSVIQLKGQMLGEYSIDDPDELDAIAPLFAQPLGTTVDASNASDVETGLRRYCSVLTKTPQMLLSRVEPPPPYIPRPPYYWFFDWERVLIRPFPDPEIFRVPDGCALPQWMWDPIKGQDGVPAPGCPEVAFVAPAICGAHSACRQELPLVQAMFTSCLGDVAKCKNRVGELSTEVLRTLTTYRFSLGTPGKDARIPTQFDPVMDSNTLVLPLENASVKFSDGKAWRMTPNGPLALWQGQTLKVGDVLMIPAGAQLSVDAMGAVFSTTAGGMEPPLPLLARDEGGELKRVNVTPVWMLVVNGPSAHAGGFPAHDPGIDVGKTPAADTRMQTSLRPPWMANGEAGLVYPP